MFGFALLFRCALVMFFFAFGEADIEFDTAAFVVHIQWHDSVTSALRFADKLFNFALMQQ